MPPSAPPSARTARRRLPGGVGAAATKPTVGDGTKKKKQENSEKCQKPKIEQQIAESDAKTQTNKSGGAQNPNPGTPKLWTLVG